jgi:hypothetical protein
VVLPAFDARRAADQLRSLSTGEQIRQFRKRLSQEQAAAVFAQLDELDRACISLAFKFGGPPTGGNQWEWAKHWGFGDAAIIRGVDGI